MAPGQRIRANPPKVLPTPFSIDLSRSAGGMPRHNPVAIATMSREIKGLIFLADSQTCKVMARMMMRMVIVFGFKPSM